MPDGGPSGGLIHPALGDDVLSREEQKAHPLFTGRVKVYPKAIAGKVRSIKWAVLIALLGIYYFTPWLRWNRGPDAPDQAVLIDMDGRRAYFFFIEIWPQEAYYLTGLLIMGAIGLFLVTSLFGRIWCGFTCPQTVWTDLFMWVERQIEGDRTARMRLDKAPTTGAKIAKKMAKHGSWLLISLLTGGAWIMYFQDAPTFVVEFFTGQSGVGTYFFVGLFTATTYVLAGWAREQVCTYMCPWPRFQAALLDPESLVVSYEKSRGEPRGKHKKGESWDDRGDCIDCKQCVSVCPTGIDIRDGIQLECIGCGLCIDACNDIMAKVGRPPELITFTSEANQKRSQDGQARVFRPIRPRTIVYVGILLIVAGLMAFGLLSRESLGVTVNHDRNPLFVMLSDGSIRNGYQIKILNKQRQPQTVTLSVEGIDGAQLSIVGQTDGGVMTLDAPGDGVATYIAHVTAPSEAVTGGEAAITFVAETAEGERTVQGNVFRGPEK